MIEHGTSHLQFENKFLKEIENIYEHSITLLDKRYVRNFYGVSNACNEWLKHFHIEAKGVIYNSIDLDILNGHSSNENKLCNKYNLDDNIIKFCFVGRIIKEKGIKELVTSFLKLKTQYDNICLFIAGEGPLVANVIDLEQQGIYYLGKLSRNDVIDLLLESDVFCLPSVSEGFSTAVLEAAICKSYIITTERGGSKELIKDRSYGSIIKNNDSDLIYLEMEKIINNVIHINECTKKTYKEVTRKYTWQHTTENLLKIIKKEVKEWEKY